MLARPIMYFHRNNLFQTFISEELNHPGAPRPFSI